MDWRLRMDVVEDERELVLVDLGAGGFAAQDLGEDIGAVVGAMAAWPLFLLARRLLRNARQALAPVQFGPYGRPA